MARSYQEIRDLLEKALADKLGAEKYWWVVDMYPDHCIYESNEHYYQCTYVISDAGEVTLGTATEVERKVEYVPMQAACQIMAAKEGDSTGFKWEVRVAAFGKDLNGNFWDKDVLTAALDKFEGAKVFMLDEAQHQAKPHRFGKPVGNMVGVLQGAFAKADGIYATLILLPTATWLRDNLVGCAEMGLDNVLGLSVDVSGKLGSKMEGAKKLPMMTSINSVTVDVVYDPVAKGEFLKMAAARQTGQKQEESPMLKTLLAGLARRNKQEADRIQAAVDAQTVSEDQAVSQIMAALDAQIETGMQAGQQTLQEMKLLACGLTLTSTLAASKLPEPVQEKLRAAFTGVAFEESSLQAAIKAEKEMLDKLTASGIVTGAGEHRIAVGRESVDKLQAAFDKMLNVRVADDLQPVPGFKSLQAAYVEMTGDSELRFEPSRRLQAAAFDSTTFPQALGNSMHRRVVQDYRETQDYGLSLIVAAASIRSAVDFRPLESFVVGYYGDLPTINTDDDDYPDLGVVGEDAVEYALMEQGGVIRVTRRMLLNNDLNLINRILSRIGRGAKRGEARKAWAPLINNAVYKGDGKAIFHADHGNLSSAAYSVTAALAARTAMAQQTERESGERFPNRPVTVSFPTELFGIVSNVNTYQPQAVTVDNANPMYNYFKPEGLFENSLMTDPSDWIMAANPNEVEIVEMAYLNGQREPQMFIANDPASGGQMFVNGSIMYRISHDYNAEVVDYVGVHKSVVA